MVSVSLLLKEGCRLKTVIFLCDTIIKFGLKVFQVLSVMEGTILFRANLMLVSQRNAYVLTAEIRGQKSAMSVVFSVSV